MQVFHVAGVHRRWLPGNRFVIAWLEQLDLGINCVYPQSAIVLQCSLPLSNSLCGILMRRQ